MTLTAFIGRNRHKMFQWAPFWVQAIRELYPKAKFIAIFAKPMGEALLDDFEVAIPQDTWIEQPWDMALEFATPICDEK